MLVKCFEHQLNLFKEISLIVYVKQMSVADLNHWADIHPSSDYARVIECYDPNCPVSLGEVVRGKL